MARNTKPATVISIHALLAESDRISTAPATSVFLFLSTLSLRRATSGRPGTHQPCAISIHALLAESDHNLNLPSSPMERFLSTLSLRRATGNKCCKGSNDSNFYPRSPCGERQRSANCNCRSEHPISIHALLAESDKSLLTSVVSSTDFYPRSPCGERQCRL